MQHFFIEPSQAEGEWIRLNGSDVNHMKNVLRMHPGERVTVSDGAGKTYQCVIDLMKIRRPVFLESQEEEQYRTSIQNLSVPGTAKAGQDGAGSCRKSVELGAVSDCSGCP